jgi:hypothetical protein
MPQAQTTTNPSARPQSGADLIVFNADVFTGNLAQPELPLSRSGKDASTRSEPTWRYWS